MGIFAKWVISAAWVFAAGPNQDLAPATPASPATMEVTQTLAVLGAPPCAPGVVCPPSYPTVYQRWCTSPGVYTVTLRLGLLAQDHAGGKVWIESPGTTALLAAFTAAPGTPAYVAASMPVASAGDCYRIRVDTNQPLEVIADPGVSFLVFSR